MRKLGESELVENCEWEGDELNPCEAYWMTQ